MIDGLLASHSVSPSENKNNNDDELGQNNKLPTDTISNENIDNNANRITTSDSNDKSVLDSTTHNIPTKINNKSSVKRKPNKKNPCIFCRLFDKIKQTHDYSSTSYIK